MTYGLEAMVPMEFMMPSLSMVVEEKLPMEESREHRIKELLDLEEDRQQSILVAKTIQKRRKAWADRQSKKKVFKKGDRVLIFDSKLGNHTGKLKLRWVGPCIIMEETSPGNFALQNMDRTMQLANING